MDSQQEMSLLCYIGLLDNKYIVRFGLSPTSIPSDIIVGDKVVALTVAARDNNWNYYAHMNTLEFGDPNFLWPDLKSSQYDI